MFCYQQLQPQLHGVPVSADQGRVPRLSALDGVQCPITRNVYGNTYKIRVYERPEFEGQREELAEDCSSVFDTFQFQEISSCIVMDSAWVFYEQPNYKGRHYFLERGEYLRHSDWGATSPTVGSFRRITEF
ncbi:gamma-crystallin M2-like [Acipenser ruthenus]|uniref:gamma-crystallin M2-like n=1 Tax=Acipenser ruthenus TaxID=7906 RepID=UPI001561986E|nr:gamma-crystallin M2-like [Acipenser ruthenus]